jgi:hypothetical protein
MAELLETGRPIRNRELVIERPGGTASPFLPPRSLRDEAGRLVGGVKLLPGQCVRRSATVAASASNGIATCRGSYRSPLHDDADGHITFFNEAAAELCGKRTCPRQRCLLIGSKLYWPTEPIAQEECPTALALKIDKPCARN